MSSRASRKHAIRPAGGAKPRRAAAEATQPAAQPANKKGVLAGHETEIARLYASGKGR